MNNIGVALSDSCHLYTQLVCDRTYIFVPYGSQYIYMREELLSVWIPLWPTLTRQDPDRERCSDEGHATRGLALTRTESKQTPYQAQYDRPDIRNLGYKQRYPCRTELYASASGSVSFFLLQQLAFDVWQGEASMNVRHLRRPRGS